MLKVKFDQNIQELITNSILKINGKKYHFLK